MLEVSTEICLLCHTFTLAVGMFHHCWLLHLMHWKQCE